MPALRQKRFLAGSHGEGAFPGHPFSLILSSPPNTPNQEFSRYRKLVARIAAVLVVAGSLYLILSMAVDLQHQRNGVSEDPISTRITSDEIRGCFDELRDVSLALEKHLENAYHLLGGYDSDEAQRWSGEGEVWRNRWRQLGERCRLVERRLVPPHKDMEAMAAAYEELGSIQTTYSRELLRFGKELAPRLDRINTRVERIGEDLAQAGPSSGATP